MNFNLIKFKRNTVPSLQSLRPHIFDIDTAWFSSLGICLIVIIITTFVGIKFSYSQYFSSDNNSSETTQNIENAMNLDKLKKAIEKRANFVNESIFLSRDPSI